MMRSIIKYVKQNIVPISVVFICLCGLFLRLVKLYRNELWADEMSELGPMRGTFFDLIKQMPQTRPTAYLSGEYFLIYPFFKIFSYNKWGLAIPQIISTIIGFYLLYLICQRYLKTVWGYVITFVIVCFNATLISHATEIRVYAELPTLALATFYLLQRITDLDFKLNIPNRMGATIFFVLVIWFHIFGILIFFSCFLFFLLSRYKEVDFKVYLKNAVFFASFVLFLAMPFWIYCALDKSYHLEAQYGYRSFVAFDWFPSPIKSFAGFIKAVIGNLVGQKALYLLLLGMIVPFIYSYNERRKQLLFLAVIIVMPISLHLFAAIKINYWFLQRQFIWVMPFFALYLGWSWDSLFMLLKRNKMMIK